MTHRYDSDATRADLVRAARDVFADTGYANAGTEAIAAATGLTRGALYHQFGNKAGLFRAVLEAVQAELAREVNRRALAAPGGPIDALRAGFAAYLDLAQRDEVRRIVLIDGPAVLGWDTWQEIDLSHAFGATRRALASAMDVGEIDVAPLDELTHALLGALTKASLDIGRSTDPPETLRRYQTVIDRLIDGLRTTTPSPGSATPDERETGGR